MKRIVVLFAVVLLAALAFAQDAPKAQIFAGYQFTSLDGKADMLGAGSRTSLNGFDFDAAFRATKNVSFVGDFGYGFKTITVDVGGTSVEGKLKVMPILFGPRFGTTKGKVSPFAEALFGVAHLTASASAAGVSDSASSNKFALAFGGGLDVNASKNIAVRLAKFDYLMVRAGEGVGNLNNLRISTGIVFNF